jgi:hypothetical protein
MVKFHATPLITQSRKEKRKEEKLMPGRSPIAYRLSVISHRLSLPSFAPLLSSRLCVKQKGHSWKGAALTEL